MFCEIKRDYLVPYYVSLNKSIVCVSKMFHIRRCVDVPYKVGYLQVLELILVPSYVEQSYSI